MTSALDQNAVDLADDARRLLQDLDREVPGVAAVTAECRPPLDVRETPTAIEVVLDVPAVPPSCLRVAIRRSTLVVVGAKLGPAADPDGRYHLAERSYGRFARVVRLAGAVDATSARATTSGGELRVTLPRIADRRGVMHAIAVERA